MSAFGTRLQHAWNAFMGRDPAPIRYDLGYSSSYRPDRFRLSRGNERSIVTAVYNRLATDVSEIDIKHVRVDYDGRYIETMPSGLNNILTLDANIDQTGRAFIKDVVMSMFDEGVVAIVPTDTTINPKVSGSFDIVKARTAKIINWYPEHVTVQLYNEKTGNKEEITLPKKMVAIVENPFYSVMNEPNSTLQRLIRTLNQLDILNSQNSSGKLDLIIQLPYVIRNETQKQQAELRRKDIEAQLIGSKYGIAYTDGTERITQLNRPVENNLWNQVKELTSMLYNQLGLTQNILDGTADEKAMINYYNNTIRPILHAICEEMMRKFLTKTARTQGQSVMYFRDPFGLVPVSQLAEITDKFTRNEIASSNEMRAILGWKPSNDPRADELRNKNLNQNTEELMGSPMEGEEAVPPEYEEPMPEDMPPEEAPAAPEGISDDELLNIIDELYTRIEDLEAQLNNGEKQDE